MKILFVCVHNAGRSQMAKALFNAFASELNLSARADSAGTHPGGSINPMAREAMEEIGISLEGETPKLLTPAMATQADRIITMGCGVDAASCPAGTYISEDWQLPDPHGQDITAVRDIRDRIAERVQAMAQEIAARAR